MIELFWQALVANEEFQHILRVLNTNVDGKQKIMFALTSIKGIGRRLANIVCKKADVDMNKRYLLFNLSFPFVTYYPATICSIRPFVCLRIEVYIIPL